MLLIHTPRMSNRLGYTLNVLFGHLLHIDYSITTDEALFLAHSDAKLCYGPRRIGDALFLKSSRLLFETSIDEQQPRPFRHGSQWMLFPVYGGSPDLPFDPLAAIFYMVSRYEEYLPHREDEHGRMLSGEHIAVAEGFKDEPVVDQWALMVGRVIADRYPDFHIPHRQYQFVQTVDIDAAWCFLHKGVYRTLMGILRDLVVRRDTEEVRRRMRVLFHREDDPFDTFDYIISLHPRSPNSHLIFFALLADYGQYDKPSGYNNPHTRELLQHLGDYAKVGLHPGYHSLENPQNVGVEAARLEGILHRTIVRSRYHFLRLHLPRSYRVLQRVGLRHDYSMGYADTTGFRAGISSPYPFYDLERDVETPLTIHPFCTMDTTLQRYLRLSPEEGLERYRQLIANVKAVNGVFCNIVHNQNLCDLYGWRGWRAVYEQMLVDARP